MNKTFEKINEKTESVYSNFFSLLLAVLGIAGLPYGLLILIQYLFTDTFIFYAGIFACFIILAVMLISISRKDFYFSPLIKKISESSYGPLIVILSSGWLTITCFGALTSALCDAGTIHLDPTPENHYFPAVVNFFLWHALDLVPVLKINDVFGHTKVPFYYDQVGVAWLLLVFKIIISWVIIKQVYQWIKWADRKQDIKSEKSKINSRLSER